MSQAITRFGNYDGPIEAPFQKDRIAMVFSSGGTTKAGEAKLICMTDKAMVEMFRGAEVLNQPVHALVPGNTSLCQLPPFVCTGLFVLVLLPLYYGMTIYMEPRLNQDTFNKNILKTRPNLTLVPGPLWVGFFREVEQQLAEGKKIDLSHFLLPIMGGEGCTPEKLAWMDKLIRKCHASTGVVSGYGMSEVFSVITVDYRPEVIDKRNDKLAISVGYPFPGFIVGIFDKEGHELGYNQRGELWVNTPTRLAGYLDNGTLVRCSEDDGWIHTGDLCEMDEDGLVYIYGRMGKSVVAPDGTPVYLFDIANRLRQDKDVKESLVTAIDSDKTHHPRVVAHLVLEEGAQWNYELLKRLDDDLATMLPEGFELKGYKQQQEFKMSFICKTDSSYYGTEHDGYLKPVNGKLEAVSF
jgi:acyl-CoA synthetase (AMP-forming)/AMP-acid ligase II